MNRPKILVCVLTSTERDGWVNPSLCELLLALQGDSRFDLTVQMVTDKRPFHYARNLCIRRAQLERADYCVQIDNDIVPPANFADILHAAIVTGKAVVGLEYAVRFDSGWKRIPGLNGPRDGQFRAPGNLGGGALIIKRDVWEKIRGPWFLWVAENDELAECKLSEDSFFCELAMRHGFTVWTHDSAAGHLKCVDVTLMTAPQKQEMTGRLLARLGPPINK